MSTATSFNVLIFGRLLQGFGIGSGMVISPLFISEIAPPKYRGSLVTLSELSLSFGILFSYLANLLLYRLPQQWRWMMAVGVLPGIVLCIRTLYLPESPRWLLREGQKEQAEHVLGLLDPEGDAKKQAQVILLAQSIEETQSTNMFQSLWSHLNVVIIGLVVAALQHVVGIESIVYYSALIFEKAGRCMHTDIYTHLMCCRHARTGEYASCSVGYGACEGCM